MIDFDHQLPKPLDEPRKLARIRLSADAEKTLGELAVTIGKTHADIIEAALQRASDAYVKTK